MESHHRPPGPGTVDSRGPGVLQETKEFLFGFYSDAANRDQIEVHCGRFLECLSFLRERAGDLSGQCVLELGAQEFIFSILLQKHFPGAAFRFATRIPGAEATGTYHVRGTGDDYAFSYANFDVERDSYPYEDEAFDVVICMELLEHLKSDPMFMVAEVNRILNPRGKLFLTTPNVASLASLDRALTFENPYHYSTYSKRFQEMGHVREYTPAEVRRFLESGGFRLLALETRNVWSEAVDPMLAIKLKAIEAPLDLRGEDTFALAEKHGPVADRYPAFLYD